MPAARARAFAEAAASSPTPAELGMIWQPKGGTVETAGAAAAPDLAPQPWMTSRASVVAKSEEQVFAAADRAAPCRHARPHAAPPLRPPPRDREGDRQHHSLPRRGHGERGARQRAASAACTSRSTRGKKARDDEHRGGAGLRRREGGVRRDGGAARGLGPVVRALDRVSALPVRARPRLGDRAGRSRDGPSSSSSGRRSSARRGRSSATSGSPGPERLQLGRVVLAVMGGLGIATVVVFAVRLAPRRPPRLPDRARDAPPLARVRGDREGQFRAPRRLSRGTTSSRRSSRASTRWPAHLGASVAEKAEKEALEHELSVARDLQRRLLPPADFACPGVGIAVDFAPAAAIGGDFYDLSYAERVLTVSVADVSGHGLPTGPRDGRREGVPRHAGPHGRGRRPPHGAAPRGDRPDDRAADVRHARTSRLRPREGHGGLHERRAPVPVPRRQGRNGRGARESRAPARPRPFGRVAHRLGAARRPATSGSSSPTGSSRPRAQGRRRLLGVRAPRRGAARGPASRAPPR